MIETAIDAALYFMSFMRFMLFPCRVFQEKSEEFDTVLLAIGRTGEAQKLGLAEAGVPWTFWTMMRIREILSRYVTIMQLVRNMEKCRRVMKG